MTAEARMRLCKHGCGLQEDEDEALGARMERELTAVRQAAAADKAAAVEELTTQLEVARATVARLQQESESEFPGGKRGELCLPLPPLSSCLGCSTGASGAAKHYVLPCPHAFLSQAGSPCWRSRSVRWPTCRLPWGT